MIRFWIAAGAVALLAGVVITNLTGPNVLALATIIVSPLLVTRPAILMVLSAVFTVVVNSERLAVPPSLRFLLLGLLLASLLLRWISSLDHRQRPVWGIGFGLLVTFALLLLDVARHLSFGPAGQRNLAMLMLLGIVWLLPRVISKGVLEKVWTILGASLAGFVIAGTAARALIDPDGLFRGGALQGAMANPNALGIIAGASLGWVALSARFRGRAILFLVLGTLLILSGSRGALLATVIGFGVARFHLSPGRAVAVVGGLVLALALAPADIGSSVSSESRWRAWTGAVDEALTRPVSGVGFGSTEEAVEQGALRLPADFQGAQLHSSYVQLVYEIGLVTGAIVLGALGITLVRVLARQQARRGLNFPRALVIFGLVSAATESWMFSTGSSFAIIFWLAVASLAVPDTTSPRGAPPRRMAASASTAR